jgi:hypothetical protein
MVIDAIGALVEDTDVKANGFEVPERQLIVSMTQHCTVERRVTLEGVRAQRVGTIDIGDGSVRTLIGPV